MTQRFLLLAATLLVFAPLAAADDFKRPLPDPQMLAKITATAFPDCDAVVILKEQGYQMLNSTMTWRGTEFEGLSTFSSKTIIAKLLTPAGVDRYGTYEFSYSEWWGDELPNGFAIKVRVLKTDGSVEVLENDDMEPKTSRKDSDGDPLERRVVFKIPDLAVGDVLQYEMEFRETFALSRSAMLYFQERDPVLFSNIFITLPAKADVNYISIPEAQVGAPKVQSLSSSYGAGETRFWNAKLVPGLPKEAASKPFADRAWMAGFVVNKLDINSEYVGDWASLGRRFYKYYLDEDEVDEKRMAALGFPVKRAAASVSKETLDSLYLGLRKAITLESYNSLRPLSDGLDKVFEEGKGDASDCAYALYTILRKWEVPASIVWIRDRREGGYEMQIPSTVWFHRLGVVATVGGKELVYDFDHSVPLRHETPWYLAGVSLPFIGEDGVTHKVVVPAGAIKEDRTTETHHIDLRTGGRLVDTLTVALEGPGASEFRDDVYGEESAGFLKRERKLGDGVFARIDTSRHNDVLMEPVVQVQLVGESIGRTDAVNNARTVTLANGAVSRLRDLFRAPKRFSDIVFPAPPVLRLRWEIRMPEGMVLEKGGPVGIVNGIRGSRLVCTTTTAGDLCTIEGTLSVPALTIPRNEYPEFTGFLENAIQALNAELVFRKK